MTEFEEQTAVIVGGSRGIGRAIALELARSGRRVVITGRSEESLRDTQNVAEGIGLHLEVSIFDAENETSTVNAIRSLCRQEPPTILVNTVGENLSRTLIKSKPDNTGHDHSLADFKRYLLRNTVPAFLCTREVVRELIAAQLPGVIVNISSAVHDGAYGQTAYAAAKNALNSMTKTWALELARYKIRVVGVAPGVVEGAALITSCKISEKHRLFMEALKERIPARRFAQEMEVAKAVAFCVDNDYLFGTTIRVDGGGLPDYS